MNENQTCGGRKDIPFQTCSRCWARPPQMFYGWKRSPKVDFVLVLDGLVRQGKVENSPVSGKPVAFKCPKCQNLIAPDDKDSYNEIDPKHRGYLIECKNCKSRIKLL